MGSIWIIADVAAGFDSRARCELANAEELSVFSDWVGDNEAQL